MAITWTENPTPSTTGHNVFSDMTWSPALGLWVAVGNITLPVGGLVYTSADGITWTTRTASEQNSWRGVAWSPALNLFCAVATNGTHRVMTSPDGITWTNQNASAVAGWRAVTWCDTLGLFVAVGSTSVAMWSPDGVTWTNGTGVPGSKAFSGVTWASSISTLVAVANTAGTASIMTSTDGKAWTGRTHPNVVFLAPGGSSTGGATNGVWSPTLHLFVVPAKITSSPNLYAPLTSPDGITWTQQTLPVAVDIPLEFYGVCWDTAGAQFVGIAGQHALNGKCIWSSPDGVTWTCTSPGIDLTYPSPIAIYANTAPSTTFVAYQELTDLVITGVMGPTGGLTPGVGLGGGGALVTFTHD